MKTLFSTVFCVTVFKSVLFSQEDFPATWAGEWKGTLEIFTPEGKAQELPMELHILPTDTAGVFTYTIIYGEDKEAGKRPYELRTLDAANGLFLIDEKNSIQMEGYLLGGKFFQWFEVQGSLLFTSMERGGEDELLWEIVSGSIEPVSKTGNQTFDEEEIPEVKTYPVKVLQRARLNRG